MVGNMKKVSVFLVAAVMIVAIGCGGSGESRNKQEDLTKEAEYSATFYYFDVVGDSKLDTIIVSHNETRPYIRDIFLIKNGKKERIISIEPRLGSEFVLLQPSVDMIYLQANSIQTDKKGLRIISRNTDVIPDCIFIDLFYDGIGWIVKRVHLLNTENISSSIGFFIKSVDKGISVVDMFGEDLLCNPHEHIVVNF